MCNNKIIYLPNGEPLVDVELYYDLANTLHDTKDPYNINNVNFTTIGLDDERWNYYKTQRLERGFDDTECWNLDSTISQFIEPRLKVFKEQTAEYPANLSKEEWDKVLNKMLDAFHYINNDPDNHTEEINEGLDLFRKYFFDLWW